MKTWIGSDFHWSHANIIHYCPKTRGNYRSVSHMNESMINEWNALVSSEDTVYMLGDIAFCGPEESVKILQRLNGQKILIEGNHDYKNLKNQEFRKCFNEIHPVLRTVYNKQLIIMSHFPYAEWDQMHRGSVHFYGHLHQNTVDGDRFRARNVGFDCTGKILTLLDDAVADALKGEVKPHNH